MSRYKYRKIYTWNAGIAYISGLIASDGCLANDNRHINLTSKDLQLVNITKDILNLKVKQSIKIGGYGTIAHNLNFSDVSLYDFFEKAGIHPCKSKTIRTLAIPNAFYADFLRGLFDGDGTVYGFKDTRWANSYMYYLNFVSASKNFLQWIQETNAKLASVSNGSIRMKNRCLCLEYAKADTQKLFEFMYYTPALPKLTRKYNKIIHFMKTDPYAIIDIHARVP